jgi:hypothetical protein
MSSGTAPRTPSPPAHPTNPLGIVGLCLALLGLPVLAGLSVLHFLDVPLVRGLPAWQLIACGALSPLGLVVSGLGIFRVPKGTATAGVVFGLLGTLYLAGAGTLLVADEMDLFTPPAEQEKRREERSIARVEEATAIIAKHVAANGSAPTTEQGSRMIAGFVDGWGRSIHYLNEGSRDGKDFLITSPGPDGEYGNHDDITNKSLAKQREKEDDANGDDGAPRPASSIQQFMQQPRPGNGVAGP